MIEDEAGKYTGDRGLKVAEQESLMSLVVARSYFKWKIRSGQVLAKI
jgi:hypothetical protein